MIFFADKIVPNFSYNTSYLSFSALAWQKTSCLFIISFVFLNFSVFCILYPICCKTQHLSRIFHSCFCSWSYYLVFQHVTVDSTFYNRLCDNATISTIELKNIWSRSSFELFKLYFGCVCWDFFIYLSRFLFTSCCRLLEHFLFLYCFIFVL